MPLDTTEERYVIFSPVSGLEGIHRSPEFLSSSGAPHRPVFFSPKGGLRDQLYCPQPKGDSWANSSWKLHLGMAVELGGAVKTAEDSAAAAETAASGVTVVIGQQEEDPMGSGTEKDAEKDGTHKSSSVEEDGAKNTNEGAEDTEGGNEEDQSGLRFTMQQPAWVSEMAKDLPEVPFGSNIVDLPAFTGSGALDTDLYTARFRKISQLVQQYLYLEYSLDWQRLKVGSQCQVLDQGKWWRGVISGVHCLGGSVVFGVKVVNYDDQLFAMHLVREVKKEDATNTAKLPHKQKLLLNKVTTTCFGGHSVFAGGKVGIVQFNDSFTGCLGVFFLDTEIFEVIKNVDVVTFNKDHQKVRPTAPAADIVTDTLAKTIARVARKAGEEQAKRPKGPGVKVQVQQVQPSPKENISDVIASPTSSTNESPSSAATAAKKRERVSSVEKSNRCKVEVLEVDTKAINQAIANFLSSKVCAQTLGQIIKDHGAALGTVIADRVDILAGKSTTEMQVLSNQIKQYRSAIKDENQQDKLDLRQLLHQLKTVSDSLSVSATNLSNLELDLKKLVRATTAAMEAVAPVFPTGSAQVSDLTTTAMAEETTSAGQPSANLGKQKLVMTPGKTLGIAAHILAQSKLPVPMMKPPAAEDHTSRKRKRPTLILPEVPVKRRKILDEGDEDKDLEEHGGSLFNETIDSGTQATTPVTKTCQPDLTRCVDTPFLVGLLEDVERLPCDCDFDSCTASPLGDDSKMEVIPNLCGLFVPGEGLHISESGESAVSLPLEWSAHLHSLAANLFEKSGGSITRLKSMTWTMFKCLEYLWTYFLARLSGLRPILLDAPVSPKLESKDKRGQMAPGSLHRFVNRQPEPLRAMVRAVCGLFIGEDESQIARICSIWLRRVYCRLHSQKDKGAKSAIQGLQFSPSGIPPTPQLLASVSEWSTTQRDQIRSLLTTMPDEGSKKHGNKRRSSKGDSKRHHSSKRRSDKGGSSKSKEKKKGDRRKKHPKRSEDS